MTVCSNCGEYPGTVLWLGEGGGVAVAHGAYARLCQVCVLRAQIEHAEARAARLPALRAELAVALRAQLREELLGREDTNPDTERTTR